MMLQEKLKKLKEAFTEQLPEKLHQIEEALNVICRDGWDPQAAENAARLLHTLAGTAGTFGFSVLRKAAKETETMLKAAMLEDGPPSDETLAAILRQASALRTGSGNSVSAPAPVPQNLPQDFRINTVTDSIFLLDKDPVFMEGLSRQLHCYGYRVVVFSTLADLGDELKRVTPHLIIMELSFLDDHDAADLVTAAPGKDCNPRIPIIFLSGGVDFRSRLEAVRSGGFAFFPKPVDVGRLVDCLDRVTARLPNTSFRILIVDDDPLLAEFHAAIMQRAGMSTEVITDATQIFDILVDFRPELILMDLYMPGCSGTELSSVIRQDETYVDIPIVYLSSETDISSQLDAVRQGGDDFLTKPIKADHLISSVTTRAERYRILRRFMIRDGLTGLLNHSRTKEQLDIEVSRAQRNKLSFAFAIIDIDHFKSVNDNFGHFTGDKVIKSLARLLQQRLRKTDTVGRYGGEEFAVILVDIEMSEAVRLLDDIRRDFGQISHQAADAVFFVTFSCGIAAFPAYDTAGALNEAADGALYRAKKEGRNRVIVYNNNEQ